MKLGYSEAELFQMTPRKFFKIFDEYVEMNSFRKKKKKLNSIDDLP